MAFTARVLRSQVKSLLLILALLLCSCANQEIVWVAHSPPSAPSIRKRIVFIDKDFTPTEQKEIVRAINEWNWALNKEMSLFIIDLQFNMETDKIQKCMAENGVMILRVPSYGSVMHLVDDGDLAGKTDAIGGHVAYLLSDRANDKTINVIIKHELGHLLGAEHTAHGLMRNSYRPNLCIDRETIEQVATYNGLDVNKLNYCETK